MYNTVPACKARGPRINEEALLFRQGWQVAVGNRLFTLPPNELTRESECGDFELKDMVEAARRAGDYGPPNACPELIWYRDTRPPVIS